MSNSLVIKNNISSMYFYRYGKQYIELLKSDGSPFDSSLYDITLETSNGDLVNDEKFEVYFYGNRGTVKYYNPNAGSSNNGSGTNYGGSGGSGSGGSGSSSGGSGSGSNLNTNLNYELVLYPSNMDIKGAYSTSFDESRYIFAVLQGRDNFNNLIYQREVTDITLENATNENVTTEYIKDTKTIKFSNFNDGDEVEVTFKYENILGTYTANAIFRLSRNSQGAPRTTIDLSTTGAYNIKKSNGFVIFSCNYYDDSGSGGVAAQAKSTDFETGIITSTETFGGNSYVVNYNNTTPFDLPIKAELGVNSYYVLIPHGTDTNTGTNIIIDSNSLPSGLIYSLLLFPETANVEHGISATNNDHEKYVFGILKGVDNNGNIWYQRDITNFLTVDSVNDENSQFNEFSSKRVKYTQKVDGNSSFSINFKYVNSQNNITLNKTFTLNIHPLSNESNVKYYIFKPYMDLSNITSPASSIVFSSFYADNSSGHPTTTVILPNTDDFGTKVVTNVKSASNGTNILVLYNNITPFDLPVKCSLSVSNNIEYFIAPHGTDTVSYDNCTYKISFSLLTDSVTYYIDNIQSKEVPFNAKLIKYVNGIPQDSDDWSSIDIYYKDSDTFTTSKDDLVDKFITLQVSGNSVNDRIAQKDYIYDLVRKDNFYIKSIINGQTITSNTAVINNANGKYPYYYGLVDENILTSTGYFRITSDSGVYVSGGEGTIYTSSQNLLVNKQYCDYSLSSQLEMYIELELDSGGEEKVLYIGSSLSNEYPFFIKTIKENETIIFNLDPSFNIGANTSIIHPAKITDMIQQGFVSIKRVFNGTYKFRVLPGKYF